jgi:hypothetical protein
MLKYQGFVKNIFDQATIGEDTVIPRSRRLSRIEFSLIRQLHTSIHRRKYMYYYISRKEMFPDLFRSC